MYQCVGQMVACQVGAALSYFGHKAGQLRQILGFGVASAQRVLDKQIELPGQHRQATVEAAQSQQFLHRWGGLDLQCPKLTKRARDFFDSGVVCAQICSKIIQQHPAFFWFNCQWGRYLTGEFFRQPRHQHSFVDKKGQLGRSLQVDQPSLGGDAQQAGDAQISELLHRSSWGAIQPGECFRHPRAGGAEPARLGPGRTQGWKFSGSFLVQVVEQPAAHFFVRYGHSCQAYPIHPLTTQWRFGRIGVKFQHQVCSIPALFFICFSVQIAQNGEIAVKPNFSRR